jgi:hypothetical protein
VARTKWRVSATEFSMLNQHSVGDEFLGLKAESHLHRHGSFNSLHGGAYNTGKIQKSAV